MKHQQFSCTGKQAFPSRNRAREVARRMRRGGRGKMHEYKCEFCCKWHVGSNPTVPTSKWEPRKHQDRPTPERRKKGAWVFISTERAGASVAKDMHSVPIDRLEYTGVISNDQASAGRDFERVYRGAMETPVTRDSCTLWEPKGETHDDGPVKAVQERRELYLFLGMYRDQLLRRVCVEHREPRGKEIGLLREALNECVRWFK